MSNANANPTKGGLHFYLEPHEVPQLQQILLRAMNTWEPTKQVPIAAPLSEMVDAYLEKQS